MLFSWKRRGTDPQSELKKQNPLPVSQRDWSAFEDSVSWPSIKVWLTAAACEKLDALGSYRDQTRAEVMRDLLFVALYGHFEYSQLVAERRGLLRESGRLESGEHVLFDIVRSYGNSAGDTPPPKKTMNIRLFLPAPMKADLGTIAAREKQTVSACVRLVLLRMLSGEVL